MLEIQKQDLEIDQRDSKDYKIFIKDANKIPFPLTGYNAVFVVKSDIKDTLAQAKILKKTVGLTAAPAGADAQITVVDSLKGILEVHLTSTDTNLLSGVYRWVLVIVNNTTGKRYTAARGAFKVTEAEINEAIT